MALFDTIPSIPQELDGNKDSGLECQSCGSLDLVKDSYRGEFICRECGVVVSTIFNLGPEWHLSVEDLQAKSRAGPPLKSVIADWGMSTSIGEFNYSHKNLSEGSKATFDRLRKLNNHSIARERNLRLAFLELRRIASQLHLCDEVVELASVYYRRVLKKNLVRGRSINGMISAALYISCRNQGLPISLKNIVSIASVDMRELSRCVRIIIENLMIRANPANYKALIQKLGKKLDITMHTIANAFKVMEEASKSRIVAGKNPVSFAAAALYVACLQTGERRTQKDIALIAETTPVTIRNRFREIVKILGLENELKPLRGAAADTVVLSDEYWIDSFKKSQNMKQSSRKKNQKAE
ncbi:MAG: transcription initiation factor IIB family protein [Candidatus Hermodarchaeota archaeon]